jgi:hypothetical protein
MPNQTEQNQEEDYGQQAASTSHGAGRNSAANFLLRNRLPLQEHCDTAGIQRGGCRVPGQSESVVPDTPRLLAHMEPPVAVVPMLRLGVRIAVPE